MAAKFRVLLRLWRLYALMDLRWLMQDWVSTAVVLLSETLLNLSSMAGVLLLAVRFGGVGGLTADEVLFMLGFYELANGLAWMLFGNYNVIHISRRIGRGQIDHMLIQPRPLWVQLMTEGFMPFSGCFGFLIGLTLTSIALSQLSMALTPGWFLLLGYYLIVHMVLELSQSALWGSLAFWQPVACEEISTLFLDLNNQLGRFPLAGLPTWLAGILHSVLPIGLLAWLPTLALLRGMRHPVAIGLPFLVASLFVAAAILIFRKGLNHYALHACSRYKDMGHRC